MRLEIVAVRDRQANAFFNPRFYATVGVALRDFTDEVNRAQADNPLYNHPEDYELYHLGWWGNGDSEWNTTKPSQIAVGANVKR